MAPTVPTSENVPDRHRLQDLLLSGDPAALYWRKLDPLGNACGDTCAASIAPGVTLRLDAFLNSFYERYWRDLTDLASLELRATTSGRCRIRIIRRSARLRETILADVVADGKRTRSHLPLSFAHVPLADAVLHVEIEALGEPAMLHDGAWLTRDPTRNDVRLAIVTCSFGREDMLADNLRRLADVVVGSAAVSEFIIVHQGKRDLAAFAPFLALPPSLREGKLRLFRQENFGGTGGFVRGLIEALDTDATHVLLLDDDIRIEPWVIERLVALLARLAAPKTIGGQMLDLHEPTMLRASHERVRFDRLELKNPYAGIDLADPRAVAFFCRRQLSDYNAWWFCCVPTSAVRDAGLPIPMFIRHDDVEFGVRTVASGVPVVTMPGLVVWHEPFTKKAKALTVYYEHRNFMIAAALRGRVRRLHFVLVHWRRAWGALRRHRFEYCWALCRAMEDFLAGPASAFADLPGRHRDLTSAAARVTLMTMASVRYHSDRDRRRKMRWRLSVARVVLVGRRGLSPAEAAFASTIQTLAVTIVRTSLAFLWRSPRAEDAYRANVATYTSPASWRRLLGLPCEDS